jgi:hypothetical protein
MQRKDKQGYPQQHATPPPGVQYNTAPPDFTPPRPIYKSKRKRRFWFYFAFLAVVLAAGAFMLFKGNNEVGWVILTLVLLAYFVVGRSFASKGCLMQLVVFASFFIIIFLTYLYTLPPEDQVINNNTADLVPSRDSSEIKSTGTVNAEAGGQIDKPAFRMDYLSFEMFPGYTYKDDGMQSMSLSAVGTVSVALSCDPAALGKPDDKVGKIIMRLGVVKAPEVGNAVFYRMRADAAAPVLPEESYRYSLPQEYSLSIKDGLPEDDNWGNYLLTFYNDVNNGYISFYYCIEDIMPVDPAAETWEDAVSAANLAGITSDSVRSTIGIDLEMEMESGDKHHLYIEREMIQGDFFLKNGRKYAIEDYHGVDTPIVSILVH